MATVAALVLSPEDGFSDLKSPYWGFENIADIPLRHPENLKLLFGLYQEIADVGEESEGARLLRLELDSLMQTPGLPGMGFRALHLHTTVFGSPPEPKGGATPMGRYDLERIAKRLRVKPVRVETALEESFRVMARRG